jgi:energy-coupling factor transporter ATP-binding protein EcfA2
MVKKTVTHVSTIATGAVNVQSPPAGSPEGIEVSQPPPETTDGRVPGWNAPSVLPNPLPSSPPPTPTTALTPQDATQNDFIYDAEDGVFRMKDEAGEYRHEMSDSAFTQYLASTHGVNRKAITGWKDNVITCVAKKAFFAVKERIVVDGTRICMNTYIPPSVEPAAGDWPDWRKLIQNLVSGETGIVPTAETVIVEATYVESEAEAFLLDWIAQPLQNLYLLFQPLRLNTAVVLQGDQGSGKTTLTNALCAFYGPSNCMTITQHAIEGKFDEHLVDKLFVVANEVMSSSNRTMETANRIKPWITDNQISVEGKGKTTRVVPNNFNMMFTSNDPRPVIVEKTDRRYSIFLGGKIDSKIIDNIYQDLAANKSQLKAFFNHLLVRPIKNRQNKVFQSMSRFKVLQLSSDTPDKFVTDILTHGWLSVANPWVEAARNGEIREAVVVKDGVTYVRAVTLNEVYQHWCKSYGYNYKSTSKVGGHITENTPKARCVQIRYNGVSQKVWVDMPMESILADYEPGTVPGTQPVVVKPPDTAF